MKVVLFCGGFGMRMREGAASAPKPMQLIGDRPLLWHVMRYYAHFGHKDFILCLGYGAAAVKDYFLRYDETISNDFTLTGGGRDIRMFSTDISDWNITFIDTGLRATIGERLMKVREHVQDEEIFLANYADTLTASDLDTSVASFRDSGAVVSMLAVPPVSTHHVVEMGDNGLVTRVREVRDLMQYENGGFFVMKPDIFEYLHEGEDMVPHAFDRLIPQGKLQAQRYDGFWRAADTFKDRAELEEMFARGDCPWMLWDDNRNGVARKLIIPGQPTRASSLVAG
ncbi:MULTISPECIES: sugar phosphate nucleotidyltransferase [Catenuloplanes]|uniref:Glucose-1-phosphate cytidylyltransferase n=1 Tax=Catenuloplanes niger TaxID=587534 RepID=A0AAE4CVP6_9ACTN|nr:sugar phosphate nucleotidyltransferase [Catenuloplanes niger]MDR7324703.1 glucose-1-phosphate cytidylyltransferase [Catenuloplanes niger]